MRITTVFAAGAAATLALGMSACNSDSEGSESTAPADEVAADSPSPTAEESPEQAENTAVITLADGTELTSPVECVLEPHEFEGQPVLYRATVDPIDGNPRFNVAEADEGAGFTGTIITWDEFTDETFTAVVQAWGGGDAFETDFTATLDGSTITGSGTLVEGGPDGLTGESQDADLSVVCG